MADTPPGTNTRLLLTLAAALVVIVVVIWLLAGSGGGIEDEEPAYEAGVEDVSGGELIVTDPAAPAVEDVELPETEMTPVPAEEPAEAPPAE